MALTPRDKRMLQVLGVVAGLALLFFLFTTVLGGDDGGETAAPTGPTGGLTGPSVSPSATPSPTPRETLPPVDLAGARDPFSIPPGLELTPSGSVGPTGPTGGTPPTTTTPPPTGTTTTPPPTGTTTTPPPTGTTSPPPPPVDDEITIGGHDVQLRQVNNGRDRVQVSVDGRVWTVEEGALFDENFKLVNIDGGCARFLFGDQSFTLCSG